MICKFSGEGVCLLSPMHGTLMCECDGEAKDRAACPFWNRVRGLKHV